MTIPRLKIGGGMRFLVTDTRPGQCCPVEIDKKLLEPLDLDVKLYDQGLEEQIPAAQKVTLRLVGENLLEVTIS